MPCVLCPLLLLLLLLLLLWFRSFRRCVVYGSPHGSWSARPFSSSSCDLPVFGVVGLMIGCFVTVPSGPCVFSPQRRLLRVFRGVVGLNCCLLSPELFFFSCVFYPTGSSSSR